MPTNGISSPSIASEGMVCSTPVNCNTVSACLRRPENHTASGTAIATAQISDNSEINKCSSVASSSSVLRSSSVCRIRFMKSS